MGRKICVLTSAHPTFDVRIFHKECKSLARAGYDVELIAQSECDAAVDGVTVTALPKWSNRLERLLRVTPAVFRRARRSGADAFHFHDPELIPVGLLLRTLGATVVYDVHEDLPRTISYKAYIPQLTKGLISRVVEAIENWASRRFSGIAAATPTIAERFRKVNPNVVVLNNYPRLEELESAPNRGPAASEPLFLYVGMRITRARGAEEMVRAMGLMPQGSNAKLRLVGSWDSPELEQSIMQIPGWERASYSGKLDRDGVARELQGAFAGLVILHPEPNYVMSQPVKLYEYMSAGLPVICSDFPVCREIISEAKCGLLVDPLDSHAIAAAMQYLLEHPEDAREMGRHGAEAVQKRFNWAAEETKLLGFYRELFSEDTVYRESLASRREAT